MLWVEGWWLNLDMQSMIITALLPKKEGCTAAMLPLFFCPRNPVTSDICRMTPCFYKGNKVQLLVHVQSN